MAKKDLTERITALSEKLQAKHGAIGKHFHPAYSLDLNFIADTWPHHSDDADVSKVFAKALTRTTAGATDEIIKSPIHVIPTVISRLGFYRCQHQQVDEAFSTAFIATMALELSASGTRKIKASFNEIRPQHLALSRTILRSHRLLKTWMEFTPQLGNSCHLRDSRKGDLDVQEQEKRHDELTETAINVMLRWHFRRALESWLNPKRHPDADPKFQWELLRGLTEGPTWLEAGSSGPNPWLPSHDEISRRDLKKHEREQLIVKAASKHLERLTAHAKAQWQAEKDLKEAEAERARRHAEMEGEWLKEMEEAEREAFERRVAADEAAEKEVAEQDAHQRRVAADEAAKKKIAREEAYEVAIEAGFTEDEARREANLEDTLEVQRCWQSIVQFQRKLQMGRLLCSEMRRQQSAGRKV